MLMREMKSTGLSLTRRVLGRANDPTAANQVSVGMLRVVCFFRLMFLFPSQQLLPDEPEDEDLAFLAGLTETEKLKLIKCVWREEGMSPFSLCVCVCGRGQTGDANQFAVDPIVYRKLNKMEKKEKKKKKHKKEKKSKKKVCVGWGRKWGLLV